MTLFDERKDQRRHRRPDHARATRTTSRARWPRRRWQLRRRLRGPSSTVRRCARRAISTSSAERQSLRPERLRAAEADAVAAKPRRALEAVRRPHPARVAAVPRAAAEHALGSGRRACRIGRGARRVGAYQSAAHSHTLPTTSWRPNGEAPFGNDPTGAVVAKPSSAGYIASSIVRRVLLPPRDALLAARVQAAAVARRLVAPRILAAVGAARRELPLRLGGQALALRLAERCRRAPSRRS